MRSVLQSTHALPGHHRFAAARHAALSDRLEQLASSK
jgi:hypothetical protein